MAKSFKSVQEIPAPVQRAIVFICEKCSKRAGGSEKHASHRIAAKLKRGVKHEFGKGEIRIVLTSCMDACPDDRIAVSLQPVSSGRAPIFLEVDPCDVDSSSESLLRLLSRSA